MLKMNFYQTFWNVVTVTNLIRKSELCEENCVILKLNIINVISVLRHTFNAFTLNAYVDNVTYFHLLFRCFFLAGRRLGVVYVKWDESLIAFIKEMRHIVLNMCHMNDLINDNTWLWMWVNDGPIWFVVMVYINIYAKPTLPALCPEISHFQYLAKLQGNSRS